MAAEIDTEFAASLAGKDPKSAVTHFCQRYCNRPVTKGDINYTVAKYPSGFQATIKLTCIQDQEFAGELSASQKDAEKAAAQQVLTFFADQINSMPKIKGGPGKKKKTTVIEAGGVEPAAKVAKMAGDPNNPNSNAKSELNCMCSKVLRRVMQKGDVTYETNQVVGGFQSSVKLPGLPGEWGQQVWAGEVSEKKKDAEESAAYMALEDLKAQPGLMTKKPAGGA